METNDSKEEIVEEVEAVETPPSLREDFNRRFLKISNGREKTVVALMFAIMILGFCWVLYLRNEAQKEEQKPLLEILTEDTRNVREAIPPIRKKPSGTSEEKLRKYEAILLEYEQLIKMENIDSVKIKEMEYELNKILQDVEN